MEEAAFKNAFPQIKTYKLSLNPNFFTQHAMKSPGGSRDVTRYSLTQLGKGLLKNTESPSHWNTTVIVAQANLSTVAGLLDTYEPPRLNV